MAFAATNPGVITNLRNHFLIATPQLEASEFSHSVIFICSHNAKEGAMGMVVNKPLPDISFTDIADSMGVKPLVDKTAPIIFQGGPVEDNRGFVIHTNDYLLKNSLNVSDTLALSATAHIVNDIALGKGPKELTFCLGYAGWAPGQLEDEIADNSWLVLPASDPILFDLAADKKHSTCMSMLGMTGSNYLNAYGEA